MPKVKTKTIGELRMEAQKGKLIRAVIYPEKKLIGCVLQQAAMGGDSSICQLFDTSRWEVGGFTGGKGVSGTLEDWKKLAEKWNAIKTKEAKR